ncbi:amidohydrolase family protein [Muricoccus aerilatus]|uniref:amidohydrolase family protein n=1 Tax=Muricoccus aerilatus TaxID=452982 RepID=UPI0005C1A274|nr:amidohydrolase family protein [Roseomonas aerilata]
MAIFTCEPAGHAPACGCGTGRRGLLRGAAALGAALGSGLAWSALLPTPALAQAAASKPRRIDVHHHLTPPLYKDVALSRVEMSPPARDWTPEKTVADMDAAGIDVAMLSVSTPGLGFAEGEERRRLARVCNEYAAEMAQRHPGRFGSFAAVPLPDVDGALAEAVYALDTLKADGLLLFTSYGNTWLGDEKLHPLYEELNRRKAIVATHPLSPQCCTNVVPQIADTVVEFGTDTSRTIASLMFSGTAAKYPDIRFIFSHAGGTLPFLIERLDFQARPPAQSAKLYGGAVRPALGHFLYDTAQAANPVALGALRQLVPTSQIVLGTDFPYRTSPEQVQGLAGCGLDPATLRAIECGNAEALIPRLKV